MSTGILLTGKRGQGKSLAAVGRIREYLRQGRPVATNLDLYLEHFGSPFVRNVQVYRLPDYPEASDFKALPFGNPKLYYRDDGTIGFAEGYTDESNGLIVLDEVASFLNARDWNDKSKKEHRDALNDWFRHSRKYGWDILMLAQHEDLIDKQTRTALFEMWGVCKRMDRLNIPLITPLSRLVGLKLKPPKIHVAVIRYGMSELSPVSDRWMYRGHDLYRCYDTTQVLGKSDIAGVACLLTPYHLKGRYISTFRKVVMYSQVAVLAGIVGAAAGGAGTAYYYPKLYPQTAPQLTASAGQSAAAAPAISPVRVTGIFRTGHETIVTLDNGQTTYAQAEKQLLGGETQVQILGQWYSTKAQPKPEAAQ